MNGFSFEKSMNCDQHADVAASTKSLEIHQAQCPHIGTIIWEDDYENHGNETCIPTDGSNGFNAADE